MPLYLLDGVTLTSLTLPYQVTIYGSLLLFGYFSLKAIHHWRTRRPLLPAKYGHHWTVLQLTPGNIFCSICEGVIVDGLKCDYCGIYSDYNCYKTCNYSKRCKPLGKENSLQPGPSNLVHHWVKGNLSPSAICFICGDDCDEDTAGLTGYRCSYCQATCHSTEPCWDEVEKNSKCDLGRWRECIVPPNLVSLKTVWTKRGRKQVIDSVHPYSLIAIDKSKKWTPVVVVGNRRAGNGDGEKVLSSFRMILNPVQVIDLDETPPEAGLEWSRILSQSSGVTIYILVAGGDGTVTWLLNAVEALKLDPKPVVGMIPLGTGNDLSRVLGWGESFDLAGFSPDHTLRQLLSASPVQLDRWNVQFTPPRSGLMRLAHSSANRKMNNYFSMGVDALVTLNFHKTRESWLYQVIFCNRFFNKFLYSYYGTKDALERQCKNLNEKISLEIDGTLVELPELESIVLLNISSWAGGHDLWNIGASKNDDIAPQSPSDGLLEVMGLYSTFHIGQLMIGLSSPLRFGQASRIVIKLKNHVPVQVDGEPWLQPPCQITLSHSSVVNVLSVTP